MRKLIVGLIFSLFCISFFCVSCTAFLAAAKGTPGSVNCGNFAIKEAKFKPFNDKFKKTSGVLLMYNWVKANWGYLAFDASMIEENGVRKYFLNPGVYADDWMFIHEADILIDGENTNFKLPRGSRDTLSGTHGICISERNGLEVTRQFLERITAAQSVEVRLSGEKGYTEGKLSKLNLANLRKLLK